MLDYPIIHEYTDLTKEDLIDFAFRISNDLTDAAFNRYPRKDLNSIHYIKFKMTIDRIGTELILFGMAVIENRRYLRSKDLMSEIRILKHNYPNVNHLKLITDMYGIFQSYYNCMKEAFLKLECYEMIPVLDRKFKTIQKIFNEEIKSLN